MKAGWVPSVGVVVVAILVAVYFKCEYDQLNSYFQGVAGSMTGVAFEMLLLVIVLGTYEYRREKHARLHDLKRRIDDFKGLDNDYAHAVIASSLRELADNEITDIDFRGCRLKNFPFSKNGVKSLKGSIFADGFWANEARRNFGYIEDVDFSHVDCRNVKFSTGNLSFARYENCNFWDADLRNASFRNASLKWDSEKVIADKSQWHDGEGAQIYLPAFNNADLDQTKFDNCSFACADFRGATNILSASFRGAAGLETCFFDEAIKEKLKVR